MSVGEDLANSFRSFAPFWSWGGAMDETQRHLCNLLVVYHTVY